MTRSGVSVRGRRVAVFCLLVGIMLAGCGTPEEFPTPTPSPRTSPTPTVTTVPSPPPTRFSTPEPEAPSAATPTFGATPSPLSPRPSATGTTTPTPGMIETPSASEQTVPITSTATGPNPGPISTVVIVQPVATASGTAIATVVATLVPEPTPTLTPIPEPTATSTPTLEPEPTPTPDLCPGAIQWYDAINNIGATVTVIGPVVAAYWAQESQGKPTFLNLGLPYPDPGRFTVLIWIDGRWNFDVAPEEVYLGSTICVSGTIALYEGGAEMEVNGPEWIWVP